MLPYLLSTLKFYMSAWEMEKEEGQDMAEYGLLLALIAVIVVVALVTLGPVIAGVYSDIEASF
jgi:pilus assembly protein Flp/PilA